MNTTTRDEEILRAFVASLRGETPPPNQDPAIALLVRNLVAARSDYMVKVRASEVDYLHLKSNSPAERSFERIPLV